MASRLVLRAVIALALFAAVSVTASQTDTQSRSSFPSFPKAKVDLVISGELSAGKSFKRDIGSGLVFELVPSPASFGNGWDVEIVPDDPAAGFAEYASIATPPYHQYKPTYLNASYGVTADEAVKMVRKFQFVETPAGSQAASVVVNTVVYTLEWTAHRDSIVAQAAKIPVGVGELRIVRSRITPGKNVEDLGSIDWIKFQVRLWFHSGTTMEQVLFPVEKQ
jgi:hypothetical protein